MVTHETPPASPRLPLGAGCFGQLLPVSLTDTPSDTDTTGNAEDNTGNPGNSNVVDGAARAAVPAAGLHVGSPDPRRRSQGALAHAPAVTGSPAAIALQRPATPRNVTVTATATTAGEGSPSAVSPPKRVPHVRRSPLSGGGMRGSSLGSSSNTVRLPLCGVLPVPSADSSARTTPVVSAPQTHSLSPSPHRFRGTLEVSLGNGGVGLSVLSKKRHWRYLGTNNDI